MNADPTLSAPTSPSLADARTLDGQVPVPSLPGYEMLSPLGHGGMGVVWTARQTSLGRTVAVKMVLNGEYASADSRRRFRSEAEAVARLRHPNIVEIIDIGEQSGTLYYSMELCPGGSLADRLKTGPMQGREAATLVETVAWAVEAVHGANIIHRDLKPANVLLTADGRAKVSDFGLARRLDEKGHTQTGAVVGTPAYMAPEQARGEGKGLGPAADVYALGAIMFECLTGRPPFCGPTMEVLRAAIHDDPPRPRSLSAVIDADLEAVCLRCLEKESSRRYATAAELADDLGRYLRGEPVRAARSGSVSRGMRWARRRWPSLVLAAAVAALLAATAYLWYRGEVQARQLREQREEIAMLLAYREGLSIEQETEFARYRRWLKTRPEAEKLSFNDAISLFTRERRAEAGGAAEPKPLPKAEGRLATSNAGATASLGGYGD